MVIKAQERIQTAQKGARGGTGEIYGLTSIGGEASLPDTHISMAAQMTLPAGSSVGVHTHENDEELYCIVSGHGTYIRNNGDRVEVGPGDVTLTRRGEQHSILADHQEPITFFAVIVR